MLNKIVANTCQGQKFHLALHRLVEGYSPNSGDEGKKNWLASLWAVAGVTYGEGIPEGQFWTLLGNAISRCHLEARKEITDLMEAAGIKYCAFVIRAYTGQTDWKSVKNTLEQILQQQPYTHYYPTAFQYLGPPPFWRADVSVIFPVIQLIFQRESQGRALEWLDNEPNRRQKTVEPVHMGSFVDTLRWAKTVNEPAYSSVADLMIRFCEGVAKSLPRK